MLILEPIVTLQQVSQMALTRRSKFPWSNDLETYAERDI